MIDLTKFLTTRQLAERWAGHFKIGTLNNWRSKRPRQGPEFAKFGGKVLYPIEAVERYEREHLVAANDNNEGGTNAVASNG